ncbi:MAG: glycosyltransferase [Acidimicrobiia bacterium]|nr:glycosyltransferase [Acidimicrobiia bacterium]
MSIAARPLRVLWLIKGLGPGGAERLLVHQARVADRDEVDLAVGFLVPWKVHLIPDLAAAGVRATCFPNETEWDLRWARELRQVLLTHPADVVHVHSPYVASVVRLLVRTLPRATRPAVVVTEHNRWPRHARATRLANRTTMALDDASLAVSADVRATMPQRLAERVEVITHGIELGAPTEAIARRDLQRARLGIGVDEFVIGTVANYRREKAWDLLLDAAAELFRRRPDAPVRFVTVGQGPLADDVHDQHARLGLGDRFVLLGYRPEPLWDVAAFDLFTLCSRHEGLPVALMEALACHVPVVATDVGGVSDVVRHDGEGLLVPAEDGDALVEAWLRLLDEPSTRQRLADGAARSADRFDITTAQRRLEAIYRGVAGRQRCAPA